MSKVKFYVLQSASYDAYLSFIAKLTRQLYQQGERITIYGDDALLTEIDTLLWSEGDYDFFPHHHYKSNDGANWLKVPVLLVDSLNTQQVNPHILVNLSDQVVTEYQQYETVVEIVYQEANRLKSSRHKYRAYQQAGFEIVTHKMA